MKNLVSHQAVILGATALISLAGEPLQISSFTIDGGGAMRTTGDSGFLVLSGTIGQPDAGVMTGGDFKVTGGFWLESPSGDCDANGFVDLADHAAFVDCMGGPDPNEEALGACRCFDTSGDELVDLLDFAEAQRNFAE